MNERERKTRRSAATPSPIPLLGALILEHCVRFIASYPAAIRSNSVGVRGHNSALALASLRYLAASSLSGPPPSVGIRFVTPRRLNRPS